MSLQQPDVDKLNTIMAAVEADPSIAHTTAQLAKLTDISPLRFRQVFKQHTGISVQQFLIDAKMKKAAALLASDFTIKEISQLVGYSDVTSFYRTFTKYYRCTPVAYRNKNTPG